MVYDNGLLINSPCMAHNRKSMTSIQVVSDFLAQFAPLSLAADWDNVGLLAGDPTAPAEKIMTCLTITLSVMEEAISEGASLIVTHHPLPFRPLKQLTTQSTTGMLLWKLARAGIAIYSPHTAFDSATQGINQRWAEELELTEVKPLEIPLDAPAGAGTGRFGKLSRAAGLIEVATRIAKLLDIRSLQIVGDADQPVSKVAIGCGSGGSLLTLASKAGCDLFVTGEASFHTSLEAEALGIALVLTGHYASERFAVEDLAHVLAEQFPECRVWPSRRERDPIGWLTF
jgi:dinuclear metal center YbgI/SA1388 family protein